MVDDIALFVRISIQFVEFVELRMLNPVDQFVTIGPNRSVVSVQNPGEGSIIAVVLDQYRFSPRARPPVTRGRNDLPWICSPMLAVARSKTDGAISIDETNPSALMPGLIARG